MKIFTSTSPEVTQQIAKTLGEALFLESQLVIGLFGSLGAGKTTFTRGLVTAKAPELAHWVSSPTYSVINNYPCEPEIHHLDLYRLETLDDLESIGFWELLDEGILLIEWPERIPEIEHTIDIMVSIRTLADRTKREIFFDAKSKRGENVLQKLSL